MDKKHLDEVAEVVDSGFGSYSYGSSNETQSITSGVAKLSLQDSKKQKLTPKSGYLLEQDKDGDSILHLAIANGNEKLAMEIIDLVSSESINLQNNAGQTAVMIAVLVKMIPVIRRLIDVGADLELCECYGNNIVHIAAENGLESSLMEIFTQSRTCFLFVASQLTRAIESRNNEGYTPFHLAVRNKHLDCASILRTIGSDVNAMDYKAGFTPLHHLVQLGDISLVESFIVEFHPDIDALSYAGVTPLHLACCNDLEPIADILIMEGADPRRESMEGLSWTNVVQLRHNQMELCY